MTRQLETENNPIQQVHIIPFDLGCIFNDCLSVNNSKNSVFAKSFNQNLINLAKEYGIEVKDNITLKHLGQVVDGISFDNSDLVDSSICIASLLPHLKCYILSNGVGIFVLSDFDGNVLKNTDKSIFTYSKALLANYQKEVSQSAILDRFEDKEVFVEEKKIMELFRDLCWKIVGEGVKKKLIPHTRKFSGAKTYKADGLSYVLTVYLINKNALNENEINHLMESKIFNKVTNQSEWANIDKIIKATKAEKAKHVLEADNALSYYSWSGVAVEVERNLTSYEEVLNIPLISELIKVEAYIQSRWFIADNCMDNITKTSTCSMESLQRLASLIEYSHSELENGISANMSSLYKTILEKVIATSEVKQLYKSVANQINIQKKIKEAQNQDRKKKHKLLVDIFLAIFTASSLYKTVRDIMKGEFSWKNLVLFIVLLAVAIATVLFNYKNK